MQHVQSAVDVAFWSELGDLKLNTWRLSEEKVNLQGISLRVKLPCPTYLPFEMASCTVSPLQVPVAQHTGRACQLLCSWSALPSRTQQKQQFKWQVYLLQHHIVCTHGYTFLVFR